VAIRHDTDAPRSSLWDNDHTGDLDDLDDVTAPSPDPDDHLAWDGAAWVPVAPPSGGGGGSNIIMGSSLSSLGQLLVAEDITSPPEALFTEDGTDFLYAEVLGPVPLINSDGDDYLYESS
jgi:hypothetical protein